MVERVNRDQRRGRRFPHFVRITLRPRKDGRAQQQGQSVDFSLAGMKVRIEGERLPGRVFRVFLPEANPPQVCGVGEVRWERRMPHACEFGLAFRTTTSHYRDLIRELRRVVRERAATRAAVSS
jgi:PilZ domain